MTALSLVLVLLSSVAHSTWNLLLKRAGDPEVFAWCLLATASVLMLPLGVVLYWFYPISFPGWYLVAATILLHVLYFTLLGRGYARGDLSMVYPVARGIGPMLVPILAVVFLSESVGLPAIIGIAAIVAGIYIISWWGNFRQVFSQPLRFFKTPGMRYAILTGLTIAAYAIIDKEGVEQVQPFLYMYFLTIGSAAGLAPYIFATKGAGEVISEWRVNWVSIVVAGALTFAAYGMVLTAFSLSRVSYVAPAREVGIVIGVLMGVYILKEPFGGGRLLGSGFIVAGLALIALSP